MVLACQNLSKSFGSDEILRDIHFHMEANEKAAIVGVNGAGKSTLLKIIMGEEQADAGEAVFAKDISVGYLAQHQDMPGNRTVYEEVLMSRGDMLEMEERLRDMENRMSSQEGAQLDGLLETYHRVSHEFELAGGFTYRSEVTGVLKGLGFEDGEFSKKMSELSGGQKTRVALGKLLVAKPNVLLLDEPTNHLDMESIQWLETFLSNYRGAVLLVSHDRYFLDRVVTKVVEIFGHRSYVYQGNYTEFAKKKQKVRDDLQKAWYNQQQEIRRQEEVIAKLRSFNREKSIRRAESREKLLSKIERIEKPTEENADMHLVLEPDTVSGNDVLTVEKLQKSYGRQQLFSDLSFEVKRGERVALIGNNGAGKTTILKIINGLLAAEAGEVTLGANVHVGYYDQEHALLHMEKTVFDEISDEYPGLNHTKIRNVLAAFLFLNDDVFKRISDLSGGERGRLSLAKLMLSDANFLILDEPSNHLDIISKEILEQALASYTGTVLYVSHDRYFINRTATRILELTGKTLVNYGGNYDYYLEKREELTRIYVPGHADDIAGNGGGDARHPSDGAQADGDAKAGWQRQKEAQARIRKLENRLKKTEARIAELEACVAEFDAEFLKPENATNSARLNELGAAQAACRSELESCYGEWEELSLALEGETAAH